jgi:hypothetical protein
MFGLAATPRLSHRFSRFFRYTITASHFELS